jgi:PKD repeat protein
MPSTLTRDSVHIAALAITVSALLTCGVVPAEATTIYVGEGDNLQAALDAAQPGDTILLQEGVEFVGNFVLPVKTGEGWITVRSSAPDSVLPPDGVRISPAHAQLLARLRSSKLETAALRTAPGAHHWDIRFLEFGANPGGTADIIQLGDGSSAQNTLAMVPHHIVLSHVYVHGDSLVGQKRCIAINAADVTITDSYVSECKSTTQDSQAICGWNGPGPYRIENNYLEGAGENVMFGGADPAIPNLVATDIVFRRNYVSRPMAWRDPIIEAPQGLAATTESGGVLPAGVYAYRIVASRPVGNDTMGTSLPSVEVTATATSDAGSAVRVTWHPVPDATEYRVYGRSAGLETMFWSVTTPEFLDTGAAGSPGTPPTRATVWVVKNLFELKNARNVIVTDNIFENHWVQGQSGYAIVLTPRNSNGACTWCVVENVWFDYNLVNNVASGFNILGYDSPRVSQQTNNINIFENVLRLNTALGGDAWFTLIGDEPRDLRIHHNTIDSKGSAVVYVYGGTSTAPRTVWGFEFVANSARHNQYGINGAFFTYGFNILNSFFPDARFETNYLAGAPSSRYPAGTIAVVPFEDQFMNAPNGDYVVRDGSPLKGVAPVDTTLCALEPDSCNHRDIGADAATLLARIAGVRNGSPANVPVAPTAAFTLTCNYLECAFADQSVEGSAAITGHLWSFGDGSESTETSGVHTFAAGGTYAVRLTVRDANGLSDSETLAVSVRPPNVPPSASFAFECIDLMCRFTDTSVDSDGSVARWVWSFGTVGSSSEPSPTFTFAVPDSYQVSLTVTDNDGATSTMNAAVDVKALIHAAFLDAVVSSRGSRANASWEVSASVGIHGTDERPIVGATITATWSGAVTTTVSCVTPTDGRCTFETGTLSAHRRSVTLTVLSVSAPLSIYQPAMNHDGRGTPTGTSITFIKP